MRTILISRENFLCGPYVRGNQFRFPKFHACETRIAELLYIRYRYFKNSGS